MATLTKINNSLKKTPKILLAPLDWGLGHATRCIPIIKELLNQKCEVWVAASGDQKALLEEEFPFLSFVELPGYNIKYGKNRAFTLLKIVGSIPKILIRIKREKDWMRQFLAAEKPDAVISDNRYGLYAPGLCSVFITHQLRIRTPLGSFADTLLQKVHYRAIRRFSSCWIPDLEGPDALAGGLSHPRQLPSIPTRYIGLLSRLERSSPAGPGVSSSCDLLVLLSGPEPQRTLFEKKVLDQLSSYSGSTILVRGLPGSRTSPGLSGEGGTAIPAGAEGRQGGRLTVYHHLPAGALNVVMEGAGIVLCRAGYSTIMDLLKLGKKAILVPTPGQTEQEYLGSYLSGKGVLLCREQATFSLSGALSQAKDFPFVGIGGVTDRQDLLQKAVADLLEALAHLSATLS
ncbi:MAG TPA: glycosyltransferase [Puia sp.]|nr:glycosyltransferase [Puia sp.]